MATSSPTSPTDDDDVVQKRKGKTTFANYNYKTCTLFE